MANPDDAVRTAAQAWIADAPYIPDDLDYDFQPLCESLVAGYVDADTSLYRPRPDAQRGHVRVVDRGVVPQRYAVDESQLVRYLPDWTDPDFVLDFKTTPDLTRLLPATGDLLSNLRPAMLDTDNFRRPTSFAQRFGIASTRSDGRSQLSPTYSSSRSPHDDLDTQLGLLSDEQRARAQEESRARFEQENIPPDERPLVHFDVMQKYLSEAGMMTRQELVHELQEGAKKNISLEEMVDELEKKYPDIRGAHRVFLENALADHDYQRMIFQGLTIDEIEEGERPPKIQDHERLQHFMNFLLRRDRWIKSANKGAQPYSPRYLYNINGKRMEWDVQTNDALWDALQPALSLVSKIIASKHPQIEAIMNLYTRQPIPQNQDARGNPREFKNKSKPNKRPITTITPALPRTLTKYVPENRLEMEKTYPELQSLDKHYNLDWKVITYMMLDDRMRFDIGTCFAFAGCSPGKKNGVEERDPWDFGDTKVQYNEQRRTSEIVITIAAEMIWPLLVPQYSEFDKQAASFAIASTILHHYAHAIHLAHWLFCTETNLPFQNEASKCMLQLLAPRLFGPNMNVDRSEPFFEESEDAELGLDLEQALWGFLPRGAVVKNRGISKDIETDVTILYAVSSRPSQGGEVRRVAATDRRGLQFARPVSAPYIQRLFTESFWHSWVGRYGVIALHERPRNIAQKTIYFNQDTLVEEGDKLFKPGTFRQVKAVSDILINSRHHILGTYLQAIADEILRPQFLRARWLQEVRSWENSHDSPVLHDRPLQVRSYVLMHVLKNGFRANQRYQESLVDRRSTPASQDRYRREVVEIFREGGNIMQLLLNVHDIMTKELAGFQLLIFDYLSLPVDLRPYIHGSDPLADQASPLTALRRRLEDFSDIARTFAVLTNEIIKLEINTALDSIWDVWASQFKKDHEEYEQLLTEIQNAGQTDPADGSWKRRFHRVPTAYWRPLSERYETMARYEYSRANDGVKKAMDDCFRILRADLLPPPIEIQTQTEVDDIARILQQLPSIDPINPMRGVDPVSGSARQPGASRPPLLAASPARINSGLRFGESSTLSPRTPGVKKETKEYRDYKTNRLFTTGAEGVKTELFHEKFDLQNFIPITKQAPGPPQSLNTLLTSPNVTREMSSAEIESLRRQEEDAQRAALMAKKAAGGYQPPPPLNKPRMLGSTQIDPDVMDMSP